MLQANTKSGNCNHDKVVIDEQDTKQAMLFPGHYDINPVQIFTSSVTKSVLLIGYSHINQGDIFTSAHH